MSERLAVLAQYLLPKQALTQLAGTLARHEGGALTTAAIRRFIRRYRVDMTEAAEPDPAAYPSFNAFFTRALAPGRRPIATAPLVCPVDGAVSACGPIEHDQVFQAKGHHYSSTALVGGDRSLASAFDNGHFATVYLSPRDYHRIHMPCAGTLREMIHVPGELFSVVEAAQRPGAVQSGAGDLKACQARPAGARGRASRAVEFHTQQKALRPEQHRARTVLKLLCDAMP